MGEQKKDIVQHQSFASPTFFKINTTMTNDEWDFYLWSSQEEQKNIDIMLDTLFKEEIKLHKENKQYIKSLKYGKTN